MILEALITSLCLGGYACDPALKAYYQGSQELKVLASNAKLKIKSEAPSLAFMAPIAAAVMTERAVRLRLNRNLYLKYNNEEATLNYGFTF